MCVLHEKYNALVSGLFYVLLFLLQCLWRCYAAEPRLKTQHSFFATWAIHINDHHHHHHHHHQNAFSKVVRRQSVMKRRRASRNFFDAQNQPNHVTNRKESSSSANPEDYKTGAREQNEKMSKIFLKVTN